VGINYYVRNRNTGRYVRAVAGSTTADFTNYVDQTTTDTASVYNFVLDGDICRMRSIGGPLNYQIRTPAAEPNAGGVYNIFSDDSSGAPPPNIAYRDLLCQAVITTPPGSATLTCSLPGFPDFDILGDTGTNLRLGSAQGAAIFFTAGIPVYDLIPTL
jgi:hypothetical protein